MAGISRAMRAAIAASQAPAREAIRGWRAGAEYRALVRSFADCPLDRAEPAAERAERLFADDGWAGALLAPLLKMLARDPFFEPPFKVSRDPLRTGAILFDCPAVSITACVTNAAAMATLPPGTTIVFSGRVAVTRYVQAGGATLRRWNAAPVTPDFSALTAGPCTERAPIALAGGEVLRIDGRREAQLLGHAQSDVVTLVATVRPGAAALMREYAIPGGAFVRVASGDDRVSRIEMLLAFLRLASRADAGARFDAATRDPAFHLRWAAMREWLALDAHAALPRLAEMARSDANAEVRAAATLTLIAVQRKLETAACPG